MNASHQKLAQIVAELAVNGICKDDSDNITRFETVIATKNLAEALMLATVYAGV